LFKLLPRKIPGGIGVGMLGGSLAVTQAVTGIFVRSVMAKVWIRDIAIPWIGIMNRITAEGR
jgi:hypothetical protein